MTEPGWADRLEPKHFALLSVAGALATIGLKTFAWWITGSVGLLSDALESLVNLAAAMLALWMVVLARAPADREHPFGHGKAEYLSSVVEGALIFVAAGAIIWTAIDRLIHPQPLVSLGVGFAFTGLATVINFGVAMALRAASKRFDSIALEADSRHLMTDVWTSVAVVLGLVAVLVTGLDLLDPLIAIAIGLNILREAVRLLRDSVSGLMDQRLAVERIERIERVLADFAGEQVSYAKLRTRRAGPKSFVEVELRVPGDWTVRQGHDVADRIERAIAQALGDVDVTTHVEPKGAVENEPSTVESGSTKVDAVPLSAAGEK